MPLRRAAHVHASLDCECLQCSEDGDDDDDDGDDNGDDDGDDDGEYDEDDGDGIGGDNGDDDDDTCTAHCTSMWVPAVQ